MCWCSEFVYREIEEDTLRSDLNLYRSLLRPVLVAARSNIGRYYQPILVDRVSYIGSLAVLYRLLRTVGEEDCSVYVGVAILVRSGMAGGGRGSCALWLFGCVATPFYVSPSRRLRLSFVSFCGT